MSKATLLILTALLLFSMAGYAQQTAKVPDWENPDVNGINKEKTHATFCLPSEKLNNPQIVSLNGLWKFKWSPDPASRPADFYKMDYAVSQWTDIVVPGNM